MSDETTEERETLPPSVPFTEAPPGDADTSGPRTMLPAARTAIESAETWPGYDGDSFQHRVSVAIIDGMNELQRARKEAKSTDVEAVLSRLKADFETTVEKGYALLRDPINETHQIVKALIPRVTKTEADIAELRAELVRISIRLSTLEAQTKTP